MPWYRFNTLLYANADGAPRLSPAIAATRVAEGAPIDVSGDLSWRTRRALVRLIPPAFVKPIAMAKASVEARFR
jgi:hypothetical protein